MDVATLGIRVTQTGAQQVERELDSLGRKGESVSRTLVSVGKAFAGAWFTREVIKATADAQYSFAQLEAAVKSTGGVAGYTAEQLRKHAEALQQTSIYGHEAVEQAQALLLTFTNIGHGELPRATQAVVDLAARMGGDLRGAALQVGKALQDPSVGLSMLRRSGIMFTEAQTETIKKLYDTGHAAEAQAETLALLEQKVGGTAAAMRDTLGGALEHLKNVFGDLLELDKGETGGFVGFLNRTADALERIGEAWRAGGEVWGKILPGGLVQGGGGVPGALSGLWRQNQDAAKWGLGGSPYGRANPFANNNGLGFYVGGALGDQSLAAQANRRDMQIADAARAAEARAKADKESAEAARRAADAEKERLAAMAAEAALYQTGPISWMSVNGMMRGDRMTFGMAGNAGVGYLSDFNTSGQQTLLQQAMGAGAGKGVPWGRLAGSFLLPAAQQFLQQNGGAFGGMASGALSGFMVGGPAGAAVGALGGLASSILGMGNAAEQARRQLIEAQRVWRATMDDIAYQVRKMRGQTSPYEDTIHGFEQQIPAWLKESMAAHGVKDFAGNINTHAELDAYIAQLKKFLELFPFMAVFYKKELEAAEEVDKGFHDLSSAAKDTAKAMRDLVTDIPKAINLTLYERMYGNGTFGGRDTINLPGAPPVSGGGNGGTTIYIDKVEISGSEYGPAEWLDGVEKAADARVAAGGRVRLGAPN